MRSEHLSTVTRLDEARAKAEHSNELLDTLQRSKQSELSDKLLELSSKVQDIRLSELRAKRTAEELREKHTYVSKLLKAQRDQVKILEEQVAEFESRLYKKEEEFRR